MPTITVERLRNEGPFHVGDRYEVVPDGSSEHFSGVVIGEARHDSLDALIDAAQVELRFAKGSPSALKR